MTYALPDPDRQAEFYRGVAVKRGIAWVIDSVATIAITTLIVPFTAFTALFFLPLLFLVVNFVYRAGFLANTSGTPGMWLTGIEFRRMDGAHLDAGTAIAHTTGTMVTWGFMLPQVVSVLMMLFGPRGQGLSDLVLGTAAINRPSRF